MTHPSRCRAAGALLCLVLFAQDARLPAAVAASEPLVAMSFNIRYGTAPDGENRWPLRRDLVVELLRDEAPDVIGLQEALAFQIEEITDALPVYAVVGVGRDDGRSAGEYAAVLFRKDRFRVAEAGTFWFSETPEVVASRTWGNNIPRICTWARLVDRTGGAFWVFNVHLDHESQPSRERSAELLRERIAERSIAREPVVVVGDFNVGEDNAAIRTLVGPTPNRQPLFVDTYRVRHPDETEVGTFSGFTLGRTGGPKIDYVLVQPGTTVLHAEILRFSRSGRYPSDHFPVVARIQFDTTPRK